MERSKKTRKQLFFSIHLILMMITAALLRYALLEAYNPEFNSNPGSLMSSAPISAFCYGDAIHYFLSAKEMADTGDFGFPYRPPLFTFALAGVFRLFHSTYFVAHATQIFLGSLLPVLFALLGKHWFNTRTGIIAGWLTAASFQLSILSASLCSETLFLVFVSMAMLLMQSNKCYLRYMAGILFGFCLLTRPEGAVFIGMFFVLEWVFRRMSLRGIFVTIIFMVMTILPWTIRNYFFLSNNMENAHWTDNVVVISSNGPINFFLGNGPIASGGYQYFNTENSKGPSSDLIDFTDPVQINAFYHGFQAGLDHLILNPDRIRELAWNKSRFFSRSLKTGFGVRNFPAGMRGSLRRGDMWTPQPLFPLIMTLIVAAGGLFAAARKNRHAAAISFCFVIAGFLNALIFFGLARNGAMMLPLIFVMISVLIDSALECLHRKVSKRTNGSNTDRNVDLMWSKGIGLVGWSMIAWIVFSSIHGMVSPVSIPSTNSLFAHLPTSDFSSEDQRQEKLAKFRAVQKDLESADRIVIIEEGISMFFVHLVYMINNPGDSETLQLLDEALAFDPSNAFARKMRGLINLEQPGRKQEALYDLQRYLDIHSNALDVLTIRKLILMHQSQSDDS